MSRMLGLLRPRIPAEPAGGHCRAFHRPLVVEGQLRVDVLQAGAVDGRPGEHRTALGALIGRTRAAVLGVLTEPRTTTELARTLEISLASASERAGTLRGAGLVATRRAGRAVTHEVTPLGLRLLTMEPTEGAR